MPIKTSKTSPSGLVLSSAEQQIVTQIQQFASQAQVQSEAFGKHWFELRELVKKTKDRFNQLCGSLSFPRSTAYFYIKQYTNHLAETATLPTSLIEMAERNFLDLNDRRNRIAFAQAWIKEARPSKPTEADVAKIYASSVRALSPKSEKSGEEKAKTTVLNAAKRYMKLTGSAEVKDLVGVVGEASRQIEADKKKEAKS